MPVWRKIHHTRKYLPHAAVRVRLKIRVRIRARVRIRVWVSYIVRIWRWEEFSRCDKFSTTPAWAYSTAKCGSSEVMRSAMHIIIWEHIVNSSHSGACFLTQFATTV